MKTRKTKKKMDNIAILKCYKLDRLSSLYSMINEICSDYSRLTDGYSLATGDKTFEKIPEDISNMIGDRQRFFTYRNIVKEIIKDKITNLMENGIDEFEEIH